MSASKRFFVIAVACILVSAVTGYVAARTAMNRVQSTTPAKLEAGEFVLVDDHGHVGAKLAWKDGQPQVQLFDRKDNLRSALFLEPNGVPDLYLYDSKNVARAALNLFDSGVPNLAFLDESQKLLVYTDLDQQQSYNTVFEELDKGSPVKITARKMTADGSGLHVRDTIREHDELRREREQSNPK